MTVQKGYAQERGLRSYRMVGDRGWSGLIFNKIYTEYVSYQGENYCSSTNMFQSIRTQILNCYSLNWHIFIQKKTQRSSNKSPHNSDINLYPCPKCTCVLSLKWRCDCLVAAIRPACRRQVSKNPRCQLHWCICIKMPLGISSLLPDCISFLFGNKTCFNRINEYRLQLFFCSFLSNSLQWSICSCVQSREIV